MTDYTVADYEQAKTHLASVQERVAEYTGNNPDKHRGDLRIAQERLCLVMSNLKSRGLLPLTDTERRNQELDRAFPNAASKLIVVFGGNQYRRRYFPATRSNSGKTVRSWIATWEALPPTT